MPRATADDGVTLYLEEIGSGRPVISVHAFADGHRGREQQMGHLGRRYRCVGLAARGCHGHEAVTGAA